MPEVTEVLQLLSTSYSETSIPSIEATVETINFSILSTSNILVTSHNNFTAHLSMTGFNMMYKIYLDGVLLAQSQSAPSQDTSADDIVPCSLSFTAAKSGVLSGGHTITVSATSSNTSEQGNGSVSMVVSSGM